MNNIISNENEKPKRYLQKAICQCGMSIMYSNVASHKKHKKRMENKELQSMTPEDKIQEMTKLLNRIQIYLNEIEKKRRNKF